MVWIYRNRCQLNRYKVQITLLPEDFTHFEKFKTSIESDHAVTILHDGKGILNIARPRMVQDINSHITEEKYTKIILPKTIPENMLNHFIRGLFDAKGEFDVDENGTVYFSLILPNKRLADLIPIFTIPIQVLYLVVF